MAEPLSPERLAELRQLAERARSVTYYLAGLSPDVVLALLDRIEALEDMLDGCLCGCGDGLDDAHRPLGRCGNCYAAAGEPDPAAERPRWGDKARVVEALTGEYLRGRADDESDARLTNNDIARLADAVLDVLGLGAAGGTEEPGRG